MRSKYKLVPGGEPYRGEKNGSWKGNNVGYHAIHDWVKKRLKKPSNCPKCKNKNNIELSNISGNYKRDLIDWEYLCRSCHFKTHGMEKNFKGIKPWSKKSPPIKAHCACCNKKIKINRSVLKRGRGKFCSRPCSDKKRGKVGYAFEI